MWKFSQKRMPGSMKRRGRRKVWEGVQIPDTESLPDEEGL